jgi:hypothetical protein
MVMSSEFVAEIKEGEKVKHQEVDAKTMELNDFEIAKAMADY